MKEDDNCFLLQLLIEKNLTWIIIVGKIDEKTQNKINPTQKEALEPASFFKQPHWINMKKLVAIYCRISKEKNGRDKSIDDQNKLGIEFAKLNGFNYKIYIDDGFSGTTEERPVFQELLRDISFGEIDILWAYDNSRIEREPSIRNMMKRLLIKYDVAYFEHLSKGYIDFEDITKNLHGDIMSLINKWHVDITKEKVKSVLNRRTAEGKGWGVLPYGFKYDTHGRYILDRNESRIVKWIFACSLNGVGTDRIARILNEKQIPTRYNQYDGFIRLNRKKGPQFIKKIKKKDIKWAGGTIRGIIMNKMFYGVKEVKGNKFKVQALFDFDYWHRVNFNMTYNNSNTKGKGGLQVYNYLLNGVIKCGKCGLNYNGKSRSDKKDHFYYCMSKRSSVNCQNRSINIDKIEMFVWNVLFSQRKLYSMLLSEMDNPSSKVSLSQKLDKIVAELKLRDHEKERLIDAIMASVVDLVEVKTRLNNLRSEIEKLEKSRDIINSQLKNIDNKELSLINLEKEDFDAYSFNMKRDLILKFIKSIHIHWVQKKIENKTIRYYVIHMRFNYGGLEEYYTNGVGLDLNTWHVMNHDLLKNQFEFSETFSSNRQEHEYNFDNPFQEGFYYHTYPPFKTILDCENLFRDKAERKILLELTERLKTFQKLSSSS
jgi:site-specific DNA recombinase